MVGNPSSLNDVEQIEDVDTSSAHSDKSPFHTDWQAIMPA